MNESDIPSPLAVARKLTGAGVPCVVIGGHAVNFHGYPRSTEDIDLVFQRTEDSVVRLTAVLVELEACWIADEIDPATGLERVVPVTLNYIRREHLMMLSTRWGYVDLFDFVPGLPDVSFDELYKSANVLDRVRIVNLDLLRRMKTASARPQDLIDLSKLPLAN